MIPGPRMYGPIDHLPFIVFPYPPVYHLASRAAMALHRPLGSPANRFFGSDRIIAISIAWLMAAELGGRVGRSAVLWAGSSAPCSVAPQPSRVVVRPDRVDMLAIALAFLGVPFAGERSGSRRGFRLRCRPSSCRSSPGKSNCRARVSALRAGHGAAPGDDPAGMGGGVVASAARVARIVDRRRLIRHIFS